MLKIPKNYLKSIARRKLPNKLELEYQHKASNCESHSAVMQLSGSSGGKMCVRVIKLHIRAS